ncbi:MAG: Phosphoglycerate mutase [Parcubacteria group bacterium GW2011_GWA1_42_7]|nr:MAG: Phosphoglycerate mutase [Parcubacteria group bacterium GW2011_GWB1_42_6]KKS69164.1 MAG: Phosphoglycerate mutase [Parcubacteria group bacterium GW2011_GWA1_42_7]KKS91953.1 MAG: Phosphoglycerate mutase [Parcubacteria group bacterium GW2011_GWC1_43_12]
MSNIYIVRHGQVENPENIIYGSLPFPLSKKGKEAARKAGEYLKNKNIGFIISSPIKRTMETAQIINQEISGGALEIKADERLREIEWGKIFQGEKEKDLEKKYPKEWEEYKKHPSKFQFGENLNDLVQRMSAVLKSAIKDYPDKNILLVSHRAPISCLVLNLQNKDLDCMHGVEGENGSIWELEYSDGQFKVNGYWQS